MIAIDGKTVCGSGSGCYQAINMVSAFATQHGLVCGQEKVDGKSNEITVIPPLLESLYLKGLPITPSTIRRSVTAFKSSTARAT